MIEYEEYEDAFRVAMGRWKEFIIVDETDDKYDYLLTQWLYAAEDLQKLGGDIFEVMNV